MVLNKATAKQNLSTRHRPGSLVEHLFIPTTTAKDRVSASILILLFLSMQGNPSRRAIRSELLIVLE